MVAPDPAQRGGAGGVGLAQATDQRGVERLAGVARLLAGVDHELLPDAQAGVVGLGHMRWLGEPGAVALADAHALERHQWAREQRGQLARGRCDRLARADGDDHQRHIDVAAEEARALPDAVDGAVDAEQDRGAGDGVALQQLDDRLVGGPAADALLAPDVDGELGRLVQVLGQADPADAPGEHARPLERDQPAGGQALDRRQDSLDALAGVDGHADDRQVLGEGEQALGVQAVAQAEALGATQQDADLHRVVLVDVEQCVGEEAVAGAVALPEVRRELQAVVVHSASPSTKRRMAWAAARQIASGFGL